MDCIYCGSKTRVINSRKQMKAKQVWRRRKCSACLNIFTTIEKINFSNTLLITKKSGKLEDFVKEKLLFSIYNSLGHRQDAIGDSIAITETVMTSLLKTLKTPVINRNHLIKTTSEVLKRFDKPASVHYLAYYPVKTED